MNALTILEDIHSDLRLAFERPQDESHVRQISSRFGKAR